MILTASQDIDQAMLSFTGMLADQGLYLLSRLANVHLYQESVVCLCRHARFKVFEMANQRQDWQLGLDVSPLNSCLRSFSSSVSIACIPFLDRDLFYNLLVDL